MKKIISKFIVGLTVAVGLLAFAPEAEAQLGVPSTVINTGTGSIASLATYTNENAKLDVSQLKGAKSVAIKVSYAGTTASTSNTLVIRHGWNVDGQRTSGSFAGINEQTPITCAASTGTGTQILNTNITLTGYPYWHILTVTNSSGGGAAAFTNVVIKVIPQ